MMNKISPDTAIGIPNMQKIFQIENEFSQRCFEEGLLTLEIETEISYKPKKESESLFRSKFLIFKGILILSLDNKSYTSFCYQGKRILISEDNEIFIQDRDPEFGTIISKNAEWKFGKYNDDPEKSWARREMDPDMALFVYRTAIANIENQMSQLLDFKEIPEILTKEQILLIKIMCAISEKEDKKNNTKNIIDFKKKKRFFDDLPYIKEKTG